jgi:signal transduction histidine kinase
METQETRIKLFEEKDRIQKVFSEVASSLSETFFGENYSRDSSSIEKGDVLHHVLDITQKLLCAEKCALFLVDVSGKSLVLEKISGTVNFEKLKDIATYDLTKAGEKGSGVTPWVWLTQKPFNARNFNELRHNSEGHWRGNWDLPMYGGQGEAETKFQCLYMVPLLAGNKCIGVLKYENRVQGRSFFDDADERLIDMIAALVTNLVISQRIERNRYDKILPIISTTLVTHFDKPSFYDELLEKCRLILNADFCSLFLLDDQMNLMLKSISGVDDEKKNELRNFGYKDYRKAEGLTSWILRRGASFNVRSFPDLKGRSEGNHVGKWDSIVYDGKPNENFKSLYSIPLIIGEERIGVFKVENKNVPPYYFTESDERLFDLIGRLIAVGVRYERARENEKYLGQMVRTAELGFLAAGISHEFNNYLQRFLTTTQNAMEITKDAEVIKKLDKLIGDIKSAANLIEDFRNIRHRVQNTTTFDPDKVFQQVLAITKERFVQHNITIDYKNDGIHEVHLNPTDLQTIVVNFINNAFESIIEMGTGGRVDIHVYSITTTDFVVEVADSGKGIPLEEQLAIFAPFYTTKPQGMGVGLFWVQRLVNNMNGRIEIDSPNGYGGATFRATLPLSVE